MDELIEKFNDMSLDDTRQYKQYLLTSNILNILNLNDKKWKHRCLKQISS